MQNQCIELHFIHAQKTQKQEKRANTQKIELHEFQLIAIRRNSRRNSQKSRAKLDNQRRKRKSGRRKLLRIFFAPAALAVKSEMESGVSGPIGHRNGQHIPSQDKNTCCIMFRRISIVRILENRCKIS